MNLHSLPRRFRVAPNGSPLLGVAFAIAALGAAAGCGGVDKESAQAAYDASEFETARAQFLEVAATARKDGDGALAGRASLKAAVALAHMKQGKEAVDEVVALEKSAPEALTIDLYLWAADETARARDFDAAASLLTLGERRFPEKAADFEQKRQELAARNSEEAGKALAGLGYLD
jgi:hypothetical protein